jgi:putative copper export protein
MFALLTSFIVLIERRRLPRRLLAALTAFAVAAAGCTHARPRKGSTACTR